MPEDRYFRYSDGQQDRYEPPHRRQVLRYIQTTTGRNELTDERSGLTEREREVLLLCEQARSFAELAQRVPPETLAPILENLLLARCLGSEEEFAGLPAEGMAASNLSDADRFRVVIDMLTALATELPFVSRFRFQLRIERVACFEDAVALAAELSRLITAQRPVPVHVTARVHKLRRLIAYRDS